MLQDTAMSARIVVVVLSPTSLGRVGKSIESFGNVGRSRRIDWLGIRLPIWPLRTSSFDQHTVYFDNRIKSVLMIVSNRYSHCSRNLLTPSDRLPATTLF